jgi:glutaredoxin-related protein
MKVRHTPQGKRFEGTLESSKTKFRKDHVELTVSLKFLQKFLKKKSK